MQRPTPWARADARSVGGEINEALQDIIDRMTEYGDLNQLVRQLEDLHQAEERVKGMTREKIEK